MTIARLDHSLIADAIEEPRLVVVDHYWWTGHGHRQQYEQLLAIVRDLWGCKKVVVDATGIGAGIADFLEAALGESVVEKFVFSAPSKSKIAFELLAAVNSGRFKVYQADGSDEAREFWRQCELGRYQVRGNQQMTFFVPESDGHDDFLMSAALCAHAGATATPTPAAATIEAPIEQVYDDGRF